ncbi:MAG: 1-acyl-sn-glycerol-3-phosphate acyltransferase [Chloroflexota bacterium]
MQPADKLPDQSWRAVVEAAHPAEVEGYLIDEIFKALGWRADSRWRDWFGPVFSPLVRGFACQAAAFDRSVAHHGFQCSAQDWLHKWIPGLQVVGEEHLPTDQPIVIAANHPGTFDGLAIASAVPRQDLKIVTAANPFFRTLPNARQYFIYSTLDTHVRMVTIRRALRHLQSGGALLIFPSGKLDPDPLHFRQAARQALTRWSASLELFLRKAPQARLVVAINSGFVAPEYLRNPLVRLRPGDDTRQKLAEFIQVIQQVVFNRRVSNQPQVAFAELDSSSYTLGNEGVIQAQIMATATRLMEIDPSSGRVG